MRQLICLSKVGLLDESNLSVNQAGIQGRFITVEGGDGVGKTTQIGGLSKVLRCYGLNVFSTREPGGSPGAEEIRSLLVTGALDRWDAETELLLLNAARRDHIIRTIRPKLAAGSWVLCDRFTDSSMAYQGAGRGVDLQKIRDLNQFVTEGLTPDLTLILDIDPMLAVARVSGRQDPKISRFEAMEHDIHKRVREYFRALTQHESQRCVLINAAQPVEAVLEMCLQAVRDRFDLPVFNKVSGCAAPERL